MAQSITYSICPGGTGKKIKFCCPDLVGEWEKIDHLFEGEQYQACLEMLEKLQRQHPDRPCLFAMKIMNLLQLQKFPEAAQVVEQFLQKYPDNPVALWEKAFLTALQDTGEEAYRWLLRALDQWEKISSGCLVRVISLVANRLLEEQKYLAARPLIRFGTVFSDEPWAEDFQQWGRKLDSATSIPLPLRETFSWRPKLLENTPAGESGEQVRQKINNGDWLGAAEQLEQLTQTYPQEPGLWWHLAVLKGWLLDIPGAINALRRYASLDVPETETILAEATILALSSDPLEDRVPQYELIYTPKDVSDLQAAFALSKQILPYSGQLPFRSEEHEIPPRAWYLLLDRPALESNQTPSEDTLPNILTFAALYGRQIDREARLEIYGVYDGNRAPIESLLNSFVDQGLCSDPTVEQIGEISATQACFWWDILPPARKDGNLDMGWEDQIRQKRFLDRWLDQPLGIFQGRSPRQAAQDPQCKNRLEAVLLWLEHLATQSHYPWQRAQVRQQLGLSPQEPIDPEKSPLATLPLYQWPDVDITKLSDADIPQGFLYASHFRYVPAMDRLANAFLARPSLTEHPVWLSACYYAAHAAIPSDQAGVLIAQGRQQNLQKGLSCAVWDLLELTYRIQRKEPALLDKLIQHILQQHQHEPGVLERLIEILEPLGFFASEPHGQGGPGTAPSEETSPLWTPEKEQGSASPKKLWTPDMS